jgi:DNA-binding FadR family transcriptional regulator
LADHESLSGALRPESAAAAIGRRIVSGNLTPGTTLPNLDRLAEEFSISRLTMREAIRMLAGKGLVSSTPRRGTVVRPPEDWSRLDADVLGWQIGAMPNAAFIRNLFELRRMVEPEAAVLAATRANERDIGAIEQAFAAMAAAESSAPDSIKADVAFHQAILRATGNEFIAALAPTIGQALTLAITIQRGAWPDVENFVPSHRAILDAIQRGDVADARTTVNTLLARAEVDALDGIRLRGNDDTQSRNPGVHGSEPWTPVRSRAKATAAKSKVADGRR